MMRYYLVFIISTICFAECFSQRVTGKGKDDVAERPNLLFIITDQHRFDALSIAGNKVLNTPNLDALARGGAFFRNAYTPCAVCAPARASILTGHTVENTGVVNNQLAGSPESSGIMPMKTFDEILAGNGYTCEYYGKWHTPTFRGRVYENEVASTGKVSELGRGLRTQINDYLDQHVPVEPLKPGYRMDSFTGRPYLPNAIDRSDNEKEKKKKHGQADLHGCTTIPAEHSVTAFQAKQTIEAIERLKDKTFSITCSFHFPHAPMLPGEPYCSMFDPEDMQPPPSLQDKMDNSPYKSANGRMNMPEYADPEKIKFMMADYYALVKELDDWIGKILNRLDELGLADNTLVIFTSDHGEMLGAHGMREKNVFYEESAHIPLIMRYPDAIKAGTELDHYISTVDLFASILDYCKIAPHPSDGKSLRGVIENKDKEHGKYVVTEWLYHGDTSPNYMIVKDGWKMFIPYSVDSKVINALYNLKEDPYEINNLLGTNPARGRYKKQAEALRSDLLAWIKKNDGKHYAGVRDRKLY